MRRPQPQPWRARAACLGQPVEVFFGPERAGKAAEARWAPRAKAICRGCEVRAACLEYAIETEQEHGVWGGLTPDERAALARDGTSKLVAMNRGNNERPWTTAEVAELRRGAHLGARAAAAILGRTVWSVRRKAHAERISLRPRGERRGKVIGEPREGSWATGPAARLRSDALTNKVDVGALEVDGRLAKPLCPSCGRRAMETRSGQCRACHLEVVLGAYEEGGQARHAARALDAARAARYRQRRAAT